MCAEHTNVCCWREEETYVLFLQQYSADTQKKVPSVLLNSSSFSKHMQTPTHHIEFSHVIQNTNICLRATSQLCPPVQKYLWHCLTWWISNVSFISIITHQHAEIMWHILLAFLLWSVLFQGQKLLSEWKLLIGSRVDRWYCIWWRNITTDFCTNASIFPHLWARSQGFKLLRRSSAFPFV